MYLGPSRIRLVLQAKRGRIGDRACMWDGELCRFGCKRSRGVIAQEAGVHNEYRFHGTKGLGL